MAGKICSGRTSYGPCRRFVTGAEERCWQHVDRPRCASRNAEGRQCSHHSSPYTTSGLCGYHVARQSPSHEREHERERRILQLAKQCERDLDRLRERLREIKRLQATSGGPPLVPRSSSAIISGVIQ